MKEMPTDDRCSARARSAPTAARSTTCTCSRSRSPAESKGPWDYYKLRATIPAAEAFRPLAEGECPLVK